VQIIVDALADVTKHSLLSIRTLYLEISESKLAPVKVTYVPPVTVPYLGLTDVSNGVNKFE